MSQDKTIKMDSLICSLTQMMGAMTNNRINRNQRGSTRRIKRIRRTRTIRKKADVYIV